MPWPDWSPGVGNRTCCGERRSSTIAVNDHADVCLGCGLGLLLIQPLGRLAEIVEPCDGALCLRQATRNVPSFQASTGGALFACRLEATQHTPFTEGHGAYAHERQHYSVLARHVHRKRALPR